LKIGVRTTTLLFLMGAIIPAASSWGQADAGATRPLQLSAFAGGTGTYTGYDGGQNASITAGADLGFGNYTYHSLLPSIEIRGTEPIYNGHLNAYKHFLGGIKIERSIPFHQFHPYVSVLFGRAEITYNPPGRLNPAGTVLYQQTNSSMFTGSAGFDYDVKSWLAFKAELMAQHYDTPVTTSGTALGTSITFGAVYRFGYGNDVPR